MALKAYGDKRDFATTPEPQPRPAAKAKRQRDRSIFVVQEHHARRLHYDFRLEAEGVLKSWAVPKGPSMDPAQKRLAVQVEDHPLAYATFTGTIPQGQYGAGTVTIWDQGTYVNLLTDQTVMEGIAAGRLEFALHGKQLRGRFVLIRVHGKERGKEHWLLMKMRDAFARPAGRTDGNARERGGTPTSIRSTTEPPEAGVTYTHTDQLMYPESGITKS
jgi:bifunctional non-homologous end joining protein LigD